MGVHSIGVTWDRIGLIGLYIGLYERSPKLLV